MPDDDPHGLTAPYVPAPVHTVVLVTVDGVTHQGTVLGWRGQRVFLNYRGEFGNHVTWVPAANVVRVDP